MTHDISFLADIWSSMKTFVPRKEHEQAAEALIQLFDDYMDLSEVADHVDDFDRTMRSCLIDYFDMHSTDRDDDE